jgi:prepilin-type N-terminal cleavage/methylation domain-containing protein
MSRGFTLVELLVALALAALAALLLFDGARVASGTLARVQARSEAQDALVATRFAARELERARRLAGEPDGLRFLAPAPPRAGGGMFVLSLAAGGEPQARRLVLGYARRDGSAARSAVLAQGLRLVRFEYLAEKGPSGEWLERWDERDGLPRAVRVKLFGSDPAAGPHELYFTPRLTGIRPEPPA